MHYFPHDGLFACHWSSIGTRLSVGPLAFTSNVQDKIIVCHVAGIYIPANGASQLCHSAHVVPTLYMIFTGQGGILIRQLHLCFLVNHGHGVNS